MLSCLVLLLTPSSTSVLALTSHPWTWRGSELWSPVYSIAPTKERVEFGTFVELSDDAHWLLSTQRDLVALFEFVDNDYKLHWTYQATDATIAMSPDGQLLAVATSDSVQIFATNLDMQVVAVIDEFCAAGALQLVLNYLVVGCPAVNSGRGRVRVYQIDTWDMVVELEGDHNGDRFGMQAVLDTSATSARLRFRLAASAPSAQNRTGMVRVVDVFHNGTFQAVGTDITGEAPGEYFGFALALSSRSDSLMAVGAPQAGGGGSERGALRIFSFQRSIGDASWLLEEEIDGTSDGDRLGRYLAMTKDAGRLVVAAYRHDAFRGIVQVYDRNQNRFDLVASILGETEKERWGSSVALSESGSIVAVGSPFKATERGRSLGSVRVLVDSSPFCSQPFDAASSDPLLDRNSCLDGQEIVQDEATCSMLVGVLRGSMVPCVWVAPEPLTASPSTSPLTVATTVNPTLRPAISSTGPTQAPTSTHAPTPTQAPTQSPTQARTTNPSPKPPIAHSTAFGGLTACACDESGACVTESLLPGNNLALCIRSSGVELIGVIRFQLIQGSRLTNIIDGNGVRQQGARASCKNQGCQVETPVDKDYFGSDSLMASGTIVISYGRRLRGAREARELQSNFAVECALDMTVDEAVKFSAIFWIILVILIVLIVGCCWWVSRRREASVDSQKSSRVDFWNRN